MKTLWMRYQQLIAYLLAGMATTVVNLFVFEMLNERLHLHYMSANAIAWAVSVIFAFFVNRSAVFHSANTNIIKEFLSFSSMRIVSLGLESILLFLFISLLKFHPLIAKLIASIAVVLSNYVFSKYFIFTHPQRSDEYGR